MTDLGWWVIHSEEIIEMLHKVALGDNPDIVFAELYANSEINVGNVEGECDAP